MKYKFLIVSVFSVGLLLALGGCQAQEPAAEPESRQAEQNTKVSINVVGGEDIPAESLEEDVTIATTEGEMTPVEETTTDVAETD
jgi:predicted component of type VI protein secretion system